jgi:hypothetical protein
MAMAREIFGQGVRVVNASYTGDPLSSGIYSKGDTYIPLATPWDSGVILSTGHLTNFSNASGGNLNPNTSTNTSGVNRDPAFDALAGGPTYDAAFLDVNFIPNTSVLSIQFVFASEEFPEYTNSIFNDAIGVWVNGAPVPIAVGAGQVDINNFNQTDSINLYWDNTQGLVDFEMDGFTATLTLKMAVNPGQVNSLRLGIADTQDSIYDSALIIGGRSVQGLVTANDDFVTVTQNGSTTVNLVANDTGPGQSQLFITHINGQAVQAGDTITLNTGQTITINADGTVTIGADGDIETVNFSYTVATGGGNSQITDTAFVTIDTVPCFVAGALIRTEDGPLPVERLEVGQRVWTRDDGLQPVRWIGRRQVRAEGPMAPVRIAADTFGTHEEVMVSPLHRILVRNGHAELLFGTDEVLAAARDLIDGRAVRQVAGGTVDYVHLMFDRHQVIWSNGLMSESFLPGPQTAHCFEAETLAEIVAIFPELDPVTGMGYGPAARPTLRSFEARLLVA